MKLRFHFLWFYLGLIGLLCFSIQEMPDLLMDQLKEQVLQDSNSTEQEREEKEFRREEEEENENKPEENEEDSSEDLEIEEEFSEYNSNLSASLTYFKKTNSNPTKLLSIDLGTPFSYCLQSYPPFYILFACLKIDC